MMASINDWAAKAAEYINGEIRLPSLGNRTSYKPTRERIAAIIATFAEPLLEIVQASRREHRHCDDSWYCCGKCPCGCSSFAEDHEHDSDCYPSSRITEPKRTTGICDCGADEWNARIDAALTG